MAKIIKTETQEQALKDITEELKIISVLNPIIEAEDSIDNIKLKIISDSEDYPVNATIPMKYAYLAACMRDYRKRLVSDVTNKAKANAIVLDESDTATLNAL